MCKSEEASICNTDSYNISNTAVVTRLPKYVPYSAVNIFGLRKRLVWSMCMTMTKETVENATADLEMPTR